MVGKLQTQQRGEENSFAFFSLAQPSFVARETRPFKNTWTFCINKQLQKIIKNTKANLDFDGQTSIRCNGQTLKTFFTLVGHLGLFILLQTLVSKPLQLHSRQNYQKSLIKNCERSELRLLFETAKVHSKCQKWPIWRVFEILKLAVTQCYQTGQKLVENAKKCDIFSDFQTP